MSKVKDCLAWLVLFFLAACLLVAVVGVIYPPLRARYPILLAAPALAVGISIGLLILFIFNFRKD